MLLISILLMDIGSKVNYLDARVLFFALQQLALIFVIFWGRIIYKDKLNIFSEGGKQ
jgi:hypothetical protein